MKIFSTLIDMISTHICYISPAVFVITIIASVTIFILHNNKSKTVVTPLNILLAGTFISAMIYTYPIYRIDMGFTQSLLCSFQHAFRFFTLDDAFVEKIAKADSFSNCYLLFGAFLYAFAPLLTFSFILSFFKNIISLLRYNFCFWADAHVFSELNEKTLALATNIRNDKKPLLGFIPRVRIVFTDIIDKKEEPSLDLIEGAERIGAILFRKDLESVRFRHFWSIKSLTFYLISEDEPEKIRHTQNIIKKYDKYKKVNLFVFSDDIRTELLINKETTNNIEVRRINDIQSLVYHNLYTRGVNLFENALDKVISVVIVGFGKYGQEMLKALVWFCQIEDFTLKINVFDEDKKVEEKFKALYPGLMNNNKQRVEGDAYYDITIHSGLDVNVPEFEDQLRKIKDATYFFVCLGEDKTNLEISVKIRSICERIRYRSGDCKPVIETVIYDSNVKNEMSSDAKNVKNFKNEAYNILMTGDLDTFYSKKVLIPDNSYNKVESLFDKVLNFFRKPHIKKDETLYDKGFTMHEKYCIEYDKIYFTQNYAEDEWKKFLSNNNLKTTWEDHKTKIDSENKTKPDYSDDKKPTLSDYIGRFSFATEKEMKEENVKNTISERKRAWEEIVYSKHNKILSKKDICEEWKKAEKECKIKANKSFRYEYNYRSSVAKAIFKDLLYKIANEELSEIIREHKDIIKTPWEKLKYDEKVTIGKIEHVRWNAYMRSEGYTYGPKRNDIAKKHPLIVPLDDLSYDDLRKDAYM